MKKVANLLVIVLLFTLISCETGSNKGSNDKSYKVDNPNLKEAVVKEILQTSSYTYLKFEGDGENYWGAIPRRDDVVKGNTYYFDASMEMKNFPSKELDRTFDRIYFIESISDTPYPKADNATMDKKGSSQVGNMEVENIERVEGGITIAELYDNKSNFAGKIVKIKGKVVKFTTSVLGKNWAHIQDGTKSGNDLDITITTEDVVNIDDIATFEGLVVLDKDFGYGYAYDVIIEDAKLLDSK